MNNFSQFESQNKLSNDSISLIFGILSILFVFLGCCCGFFIFVGLILGVIGWILSSKSLKEYYANSSVYSLTSFKNTKTAKLLSIIGTILNSIAIGLFILYWVGIIAQPGFMEEIRQQLEEVQNNSGSYSTDD